MSTKKGALGKSLSAIFMENSIDESDNIITLKISEIVPNKTQPRENFKEEILKELAESIAKHGILQPLVVKPLADGKYKIIAGERRWRASQIAGLQEVPALIKDLSDAEIMEVALVENLQREDLSPLEEAKGYKTLMEEYNLTQEAVSKSIGKSRPYIANTLRLLNLPEYALEKLESGNISAGHARALLSLKNENDTREVLETTLKQDLNVRQLELLIKKINFKEIEETKSIKVIKRDSFYKKIEDDLEKSLGHKVTIIGGKKKKGSVQIEFLGEEGLTKIYNLLIKEARKNA